MPILDFESGIAGWTTSNEDITLSVETSLVHSGTQAMRIQIPQGAGGDINYIEYTFESIPQGYLTVSAWTRRKTAGSGYQALYLQGVPQTNRRSVSAGISDWSTTSTFIIYQPIAGPFTLRLQTYNDGWQMPYDFDVVIDDIEVELLTETLSDDFESGDKPWSSYGGAIDSVEVHSGANSRDIGNSVSIYNVPWCPGLTHTFSAWLYVPTGEPDWGWKAANWWESPIAAYSDITSVKDAWTQVELTLTGEQITEGDLFYDLGMWDTPTGTSYIDDIVHTISGTPGGAARIDGFDQYDLGPINQNGGADPNYYWWDNYGNETIEIVDTVVDTGTQSMHVILPADDNLIGIWNRPGLGTYFDWDNLPAG
jgi:hypothetical protein